MIDYMQHPGPSLMEPTAKTYVKHSLWALGMSQRSTGYLPHTIAFVSYMKIFQFRMMNFQQWIFGLLPTQLLNGAIWYTMNQFRLQNQSRVTSPSSTN